MLITRRSLLRNALAAPAIVLASRLDFVPRGLVIPPKILGFGMAPEVLEGGTIRLGLCTREWLKLVQTDIDDYAISA